MALETGLRTNHPQRTAWATAAVQDHMGAPDPRLTEPGGFHTGIELIAVSRGEFPKRHVAKGGFQVTLGHALPIGAW